MTNVFEIYIDGETYEAPDHKMTPNAILELAGLPPDEYYLTGIHGNSQHSLEGKGAEEINLHEGAKFVSIFTGPTTVAEAPLAKSGAVLFAEGLKELGYEVTEFPDGNIMFPYVVEVGKHAGLKVMMGFVVGNDFPLNPPHGLHIDQNLHPIAGGGVHPTGGIHESHPSHSQHFGSGWQHWSRPHPNWAGGNRTVARYMAFIRKLWATQ